MFGAISNNLPVGFIQKNLYDANYSLKNMARIKDNESGATELNYNINGWGIASYYSFGGNSTINRGEIRAFTDPLYTSTISQLNTNEPKIILGHIRHCTSGCCLPQETIENPHPFIRTFNGKTYTFMHNGGVPKTTMISLIGSSYLTASAPFGSGVTECVTSDYNAGIVVDSELYFLYIKEMIEQNGGDNLAGISTALKGMDSAGATSGSINFLMSDGETLYGFSKGNELYYRYDAANGYSEVASQPPNTSEAGWIEMSDWQLVVLKNGQAPTVINDVRTYVGNNTPLLTNPNPVNNSNVTTLTQINFSISDPNNLAMNYNVTTTPNIGSKSASGVSNGVITVPVSGLVSNTQYTWYVTLTDGIKTDAKNYTFYYYIPQQPPTLSNVVPSNGDVINVAPTQLRFTLNDINNDRMSYNVTTTPNIGTGSRTNVSNGVYNLTVNGVLPGTYIWNVNASDGTLSTTSVNTFIYQPVQGDVVMSNVYPNNQSANYHPRLSVNVQDPQNASLTVIFETNSTGSWNAIGSPQTGLNGVYTQDTSGMDVKNKKYSWRVKVYDGSSWTTKTFTFTAQAFVLKWSYNMNAATTIGPVSADVNGDGIYEIIATGQGKIKCLSGLDGSVLWEYNNPSISEHTPAELGDLNNDGILEVVFPASNRTIALHANNGTVYWNVEAQSQNKYPIILDTEGNHYPYVYVASGDHDITTNSGKIRKLRGTDGTIVAETTVWYPCYSGLSAADANNDGKFEIYMGDRRKDYTPGELGKGTQAYDADNLSLLWDVDDITSSSHIPVLIDVNNDGILDVVTLNQGVGTGGVCVIDGSTGKKMPGKCDLNLGLDTHSPPPVYDIDGDGNLEVITSRDSTASVWDIGSWSKENTTLNNYTYSEPPRLADVIGDNKLEIIGTSNGFRIFDGNYNLIENITGSNPIPATLVQDVDNDGQNELIGISSTGLITVYDTSAYAPTPRVRTNNQLYSERRMGVGVYVPLPGAPQPFIKEEYPANESINVVLNPTLSIHAVDYRYDLMNINISTSIDGISWQTVATFKNATNGFYNFTPTDMNQFGTTYFWKVSVIDPYADKITTTKIFTFTTQEGKSWQMPGWGFRRLITIDHTKVTATLNNFPVLIDLTDASISNHSQSNGNDFLFTTSDGTTKLNYEIEKYDSSTGHLTAWVNVPVLSSTEDTILYIYYGNKNVSSQQNPNAVWDSNFLAIHHLEDSNTSASDSTSRKNDGVALNGLLQGVSGKIDGANQFDGVNDRIQLPQVFTNQNQFTLEAWVNTDTKQGYIISQRDGSSHGTFIQHYGNGVIQMYVNDKLISKTTTINSWHYITGTYDGTTARLYIDAGTPTNITATLTWPNLNTLIGDRSTFDRSYKGKLDEIRISNIARSQDYIKTSYNNQNSPTAFIKLGSEDVASSTPHILNPQPITGAENIPLNLTNLQFELSDDGGDLMNYTVTTTPNISSGNGINVLNGVYTTPITNNLTQDTLYTWNIAVSDGKDTTYRAYTFKTLKLVPQLLVDSTFDASIDSADLRANGTGQDWYESRGTFSGGDATLLTLDNNSIGGNSGKKAALKNNVGVKTNAYLTQEFNSTQNSVFNISFDMYINSIEGGAAYNRTGTVYIGDDSVTTNAPTGQSSERFVVLGFYDPTPGTTGDDIQLRAQAAGNSFSDTTTWTLIASNLSYKTWYTVKLNINPATGTYDVYIDDQLKNTGMTKYSSAALSFISFVADSDARGEFYVDNVNSPAQPSSKIVCVDADHDGYNVTGGSCGPVDCNDNNSAIHPGAIELCDGIDNDCNAATLDGSGEIAPLNTKQLGVCVGSLKSCTVGNWTDNYLGIANYQDIETSCDGLDNNCNGLIDENVTTTYYQDLDNDSYGNPLVTLQSCTQPSGYVLDNTDCNDHNFYIHPGQSEVCGNNVDDNCNGQVEEGCTTWLLSDWIYKKQITINKTKISGALTNFPVLVDFTDVNVSAHALASGNDLLFTAADGITKLPFELESYSAGHVVAWVKTDVSSTNNTILYLYYGNSNATSQQTPEAVWDSNYLAVQHLEETSGTVFDSTSWNNDGTALNGLTQGIVGKIDGGDQFDGVNDRIQLPQVFTNQNQFTFEAWVNTDTKQGYFVSQRDGSSHGAFLQYSSGTFQLYSNTVYVSKASTANVWHYVVGTYDGTTVKLYVDAGTPVSAVATLTWPNLTTLIGDRNTFDRTYKGKLDEIRLSNVARSQDYIKTSYNNQNNPSSFITIGTEETHTTVVCVPTTEICDGLDNNCNGQIDENLTRPTTCGLGLCAGNAGFETCSAGTWGSNTCNPFAGATAEICNGLADEDCDGTIDNGCSCTNGATQQCGTSNVGACKYGTSTCTSGTWGACVGNIEPVTEICGNGIDENCDGFVDEGCVVACVDNDLDGYNITGGVCGPVDCNDNNGAIHPGASDANCNGVDDNCNGQIDEGYVATSTSCGVGACAASGQLVCTLGLTHDTCTAGTPTAELSDGIDNNCNGQIDEGFLIKDSTFDGSANDADLRTNSPTQDWYESRNQAPTLLTLDTANIGGNSGKKARLDGTANVSNVYLTQEFNATQSGPLSVQWDIFVESIYDAAPHRAGMMLIGDDTFAGNGPNADNSERFVYLGFSSYNKAAGKMDLVARDRDDAFSQGSFTVIATDLNIGQWYTIKVNLNLTAGTYDVYVDGVNKGTVTSRNVKSNVQYVSFAQWNDGAGTFYVDNVYSPALN